MKLESCVLINITYVEKLFLSLELPTTSDERFKVTTVPFLIPDFNLLNCELDNFTFKVLYSTILFDFEINCGIHSQNSHGSL